MDREEDCVLLLSHVITNLNRAAEVISFTTGQPKQAVKSMQRVQNRYAELQEEEKKKGSATVSQSNIKTVKMERIENNGSENTHTRIKNRPGW